MFFLLFSMNSLLWNAQRVKSKSFISFVRYLIKRNNVYLLLILELQISGSKGNRVIDHIGYYKFVKIDAEGFYGGWVMRNKEAFEVEVISTFTKFVNL